LKIAGGPFYKRTASLGAKSSIKMGDTSLHGGRMPEAGIGSTCKAFSG
jgi:hypothetical protein